MSAFRALRSASNVLYRSTTCRVVPRTFAGSLARVTTAPRIPVARAFSASALRLAEGETDLSLSQKLHEEIKFELEAAKANSDVPDFLRDFQSAGIWGVEDVEGNDEVTLVRTFGNETIRVLFSIADIDAPQEPAFEDGESSEAEDVPIPAGPIRCSITITKASTPGIFPCCFNGTGRGNRTQAQLLECALGSNQGALSIDALAQDGTIVIDNISFYKEAKLAVDLTSEADWKRRGLYIGPQFDHLDTNVQEEFERFLDERGVGGDLALFVPEYAEYKEQKEYVKWLQSVKSFIDV